MDRACARSKMEATLLRRLFRKAGLEREEARFVETVTELGDHPSHEGQQPRDGQRE
jgi:hypothetical protein